MGVSPTSMPDQEGWQMWTTVGNHLQCPQQPWHMSWA